MYPPNICDKLADLLCKYPDMTHLDIIVQIQLPGMPGPENFVWSSAKQTFVVPATNEPV